MRPFTMADLQQVISECLGAEDAAAVTEGTRHERFEDLGYDSLAVYELATRLQDGLRIKIPDEAIDRMKTPQGVLDYVNGQLSGV